jgi:hypothetical protein
MPFSATISLTSAGADAGPFDLYSNVGGYATAFESGVSKTALLSGTYLSTNVPTGTITCRVKSTGVCVNYVDMPINDPFIYVYRRCDTGNYYYKVGLITTGNVIDTNTPTANCYEYVNQGLLSVMNAAYASLTINNTLSASSCICV